MTKVIIFLFGTDKCILELQYTIHIYIRCYSIILSTMMDTPRDLTTRLEQKEN